MTDTPADELAALTEEWKDAKRNETLWNARRIAVESRIYEMTRADLPEKGTHALPTGMKITTGYSEDWDQDSITAAQHNWPTGVKFPFSGTWKPDGKAVTYLRDNMPEAYALIQPALTLKPRKPAFSVPEPK